MGIDTPDKFYKGWMLTGDIVAIDEQERMEIRDRSKDLIKSGGEWISSKDMENHVIAMEGVKQCAVVGRKHPKWDERPIVIAVLNDGAEVTIEEVKKHCSSKFAKFQLPSDIVVWEEIPMTGTGKVSKKRYSGETGQRWLFASRFTGRET